MNVNTTFLREDLNEEIYMTQLEDFIVPELEHKVYKLIKSLYDLNQIPK